MNFFMRCLIFPTCLLFVLTYYQYDSMMNYLQMPFFKSYKSIYNKLVTKHKYGNQEFLIKTPRCSIPNYTKYLKFTNTTHMKASCGERAVFIKQTGNNKIVFEIDKKKLSKYTKKKRKITCCYEFGLIGFDNDTFMYTRCIPFQNGKEINLLHEVVTVTCSTQISKMETDIVYKDSYILVKKKDKIKSSTTKPWNILVLGMSTMSRGRIYDAMPRTVQYLQANKWLDYRGYHTVGDEMLPNVVSLLTGKEITTVNQNCSTKIWDKFRNAGYITAFGDDYFQLPDGNSKNIFPPFSTDHHVWPYFHVKYKKRKGNIFCTGYSPSGKHLLDYAHQFVDTYKRNNFFGMFWINTFSTRIETTPRLIDADVVAFFENINKTGSLNNTFVLLLSDHGMSFGDFKKYQDTYYEKRLPMLFMWVPYEFQKLYSKEFNNTKINQYRMLSPHDVYSTIIDILTFSNHTNASSEACSQCTSLFKEISLQRKCADAGVDDVWCACHFLEYIDDNNVRVSKSIKLVANYIQNKSNTVKTIPYMKCDELHIKTVLRTQTYSENNKIYYLIAVLMSPGNFSFEAKVLDDGKDLSIVLPVMSLSRHGRGNCAIDPNDRAFCLCNITALT
ncbi:uncharacterized protein LOC115443478 [Manduca sexta]|uniref:Uncharacterized protein n=1 Tax=Manduca sexta TaxID=7130 RepID=A0A922CLP9_MANSE|nr:uncharacterized protein LOC115443478 [Manduca sexta]XP_030024763.1 uncharacterized protein LOC115443478 [Manduca sexta]KAG6450033.1 hypothetical protein O3G_MSEX006370 [Manduca sexta]